VPETDKKIQPFTQRHNRVYDDADNVIEQFRLVLLRSGPVKEKTCFRFIPVPYWGNAKIGEINLRRIAVRRTL
jgi:hypothetical protein